MEVPIHPAPVSYISFSETITDRCLAISSWLTLWLLSGWALLGKLSPYSWLSHILFAPRVSVEPVFVYLHVNYNFVTAPYLLASHPQSRLFSRDFDMCRSTGFLSSTQSCMCVIFHWFRRHNHLLRMTDAFIYCHTRS